VNVERKRQGRQPPKDLPQVRGLEQGQSMEEKVWEEIREYGRRRVAGGSPEYADDWKAADGYLPNFHLFFMRDTLDNVLPEDRDVKFQDLEGSNKFHSGLYLGQTPREFLGNVDRAIADEGVDTKGVSKILWHCKSEVEAGMAAMLAESRKPDPDEKLVEKHKARALGSPRTEATKQILPVYIRLRKRGYKHMDLTL